MLSRQRTTNIILKKILVKVLCQSLFCLVVYYCNTLPHSATGSANMKTYFTAFSLSKRCSCILCAGYIGPLDVHKAENS